MKNKQFTLTLLKWVTEAKYKERSETSRLISKFKIFLTRSFASRFLHS